MTMTLYPSSWRTLAGIALALAAAFCLNEARAVNPPDVPVPNPSLESADEKALVLDVTFQADNTAVVTGVKVKYGAVKSRVGAPDLFRVTYQAANGKELRSVSMWHPLLVSVHGDESQPILRRQAKTGVEGAPTKLLPADSKKKREPHRMYQQPEGQTRIVVPFVRQATSVTLFDVGRKTTLATADVRPALLSFCAQHKTDPECKKQ